MSLAISDIVSGGDDWLIARCDPAAGIALNAQLQQLADRLRGAGKWRDVVPGLADLSVRFDPMRQSPAEARLDLEAAIALFDSAATGPAETVDIPVIYGGARGPDLDAVAGQLGLDREEIVRLHTAKPFLVQMMGFAPGFAYCGETPPALAADRLDEPRRRVEAGSVGIAGRQTCLYSIAGPGGWPLIGRTPLRLFDVQRDVPFLLKAGQRVRFRQVEEEEYRQIEARG